jgi:hypothetical protein
MEARITELVGVKKFLHKKLLPLEITANVIRCDEYIFFQNVFK